MSLDLEARRARSRQTCSPDRPAPSPPPTAGGGGAGLGARPPLRLRSPRSRGRSAGLATLAGCAPHWRPVQFASFARGTARIWTADASAAPKSESRDLRPKGVSARRTAPTRLHALQPGQAAVSAVAVSVSAPRWGLPKLPQFIPAE
ncbi:uncharacterized protein LOC144577918 [Callithrix jacchus]